jgi:hypothetical protein
VNRVMYLRVPLEGLNFLVRLATLSLSGMSVLHYVASFHVIIIRMHHVIFDAFVFHYKLHDYFCVTYFIKS